MARNVSVVLVGLGGYARNFLNQLLDRTDCGDYTVPALVSSSLAADNPRLPDIQARNIPVYRTLEELCASHRADLAVISSPIHLHAPQSCQALAHGMHVLCEKPIAGTVQEARLMAETRDRAGRMLAIGYDASFSTSIQALKRDIMSGAFGRPRRLRTLVLWPRDENYYHRNRWAGKLRAETGEWVLDSPVNNATAHYLHNMLYVLGARVDTCAELDWVQAELYRANRTENYDTGALRAMTRDGAEILFFSTHAVKDRLGPVFEYEFEKAVVTLDENSDGTAEIKATFTGGAERNYGAPVADNLPGVGKPRGLKKLWDCVESVRTGAPPVCGIEAAIGQTLCVNGAQESSPINDFPASAVKIARQDGVATTWVDGLFETFRDCYQAGRLPSEAGVAWARPGKKIALAGYDFFPRSEAPRR